MLDSSCGKYLTTQSTGFGAAWPRPQIDASRITCESSASSGRSQRRLLDQLARLGRAEAAGRALAAASCAKKRIRLRAASMARSWSDSTITAAEPMKQPCGCRVSKSSGTSASDAGRMPPEAPPGQVGIERVAVGHAAAVFVDQLAQGDAGRREVHAGLLDAARDRERAQALAAVAAVPANQSRALLEDVAHPVQRLEVVLQRRPAEQPDLRDVGRAQPRHAALAFDRFDHRRLFAADVGAGAAPQLDAAAAARAADWPAAPRVRARAARGSRGIRRAGRCRSHRCRRPRPRSACLRESGADRARGR